MKHSAGRRQKKKSRRTADTFPRAYEAAALRKMNRPLSSRQVKKEKLCHEGLVPVSKGSQAL